MARIVVTSAAYLGDVAPFVAPANELVARGHDVSFLAPAGFHSLFAGERFSLDTYPLDFSSSAMHADPEHERLMRHPFRNQVRLPRYWMRAALVNDPAAVRNGLLRSFAAADVIVTHPTMCAAVTPVAEKLNVPVVVGHLFPMMVPTSHHTPPLGSHSRNLGPALNRMWWRATALGTRLFFHDADVNRFRASLGAPRQRASALVTWMDAARTVMLVSPHYYGDTPPDWPPITWGGFSGWPGPSGQTLAPEVEAFIEGGDPPVLVTLGTSAATGAGEQFAAIGRGLDRIGLRSLHLVADDRNKVALAGRGGVFVFAPITQLLSRCRIAVVSGALGALAAALSAGVPVVVVPQLFDQLWHGGRVEQLGVGLMAHKPAAVVEAVARIEADRSYAERARALAARMAGEDGAAALADAAESVL